MSINNFSNLDTPQIEGLLTDGYKLVIFRSGKLIFARILITRNDSLLALATGESISVALKRLDSYLGNSFSMPSLYSDSISKLDTIIFKSSATITITSDENKFTSMLTSYDYHLLAIENGTSIKDSLFSLECTAVKYGL